MSAEQFSWYIQCTYHSVCDLNPMFILASVTSFVSGVKNVLTHSYLRRGVRTYIVGICVLPVTCERGYCVVWLSLMWGRK